METVIVAQKRTAFGSFQGRLANYSADQLGALVLKELLADKEHWAEHIDEVILGCVLTACLGQSPGKQVMRKAGLSPDIPSTIVNKVCGSGLKSLMLADQAIRLQDSEIVIAGGMEAMSQVPFFLPDYRRGRKFGNGRIVDGLVNDGLTDQHTGKVMGILADQYATDHGIDRSTLDDFAELSYQRSALAYKIDSYRSDIVSINDKHGSFDQDEELSRYSNQLRKLPGAFSPGGVTTVANGSTLNDGAAAMMLMEKGTAIKLEAAPIACIVSSGTFSGKPEEFPIAPARGISELLLRQNLTLEDIDCIEVNEAFSLVPVVVAQALDCGWEKINRLGGAVSVGHPLGCSGTRVVMNLIRSLEQVDGRFGIASVCLGGGEAVSMILERMPK